jgi:hypothetical protein
MSAPTDVVVLCWERAGIADGRARRLVEFFGVQDVKTVAVTNARRGALRPPIACACMVVHVDTLANVITTDCGIRLERLIGSAKHVFVYGFRPVPRHVAVLKRLSSGALAGIEPRGSAVLRVAPERESAGPFAGLSFAQAVPAGDSVFIVGDEPGRMHVLVRAGDAPFFVCGQYAGARISLVASGELADLDELVGRRWSPLAWFTRLMPLAMFLRRALGTRVWHADRARACFIIDDPLLKERYGFLNHRRLVDSLARSGGSASIAFIPWNYRRSSPDVAALYQVRRGAPLCVHGCDHTRGEFNTADAARLRSRAAVALSRMREHARLTGVPFDDVMVFPQGLFSAEALGALAATGYLAAVNSDLVPSSGADLTLADALDVAVTRLGGVPLFGRRYPNEPAEFAFDLFLGKPALAVEHHTFFRHGCGALEAFVSRLNAIEPEIEWTPVGYACSSACLTRTDAEGDVHVRFYTGRFSFANTGADARAYVLIPPPGADVGGFTFAVDGRPARRCAVGAWARVTLAPGQRVAVVRDGSGQAVPPVSESPFYRARVRLRRYLSEFRDDYVDTSRALSALVSLTRGPHARATREHGSWPVAPAPDSPRTF